MRRPTTVFAIAGRCAPSTCNGGRSWVVIADTVADGNQVWTLTHAPPNGGDLRAAAAGVNASAIFVAGDQFDGQSADSFLTVAIWTI